MWNRIAIPAFVLATMAALCWRPWELLRAQAPNSTASLFDSTAQTVLIRYGVTDKTEKTWRGRLETDSGDAQVISLAGYHFQPPDRVAGREWEFTTRPWVTAFQQVDLSPGRPGPRAVFPNGIYARVSGGAGARFRLETGAGSFPFALGDLAGGRMVSFADGNIEIELVPTPAALGNAGGEADFPSLAVAEARVAVAFQEYAGERDRIIVRESAPGSTTTENYDLPETRDVFRSAIAYDGEGALHVVWSAQVDGNWDLYERRKAGGRWSPVERLTQAPGADFHHKLIAGRSGDLWLAWQAFRNGQSDIYLKRYTQGKWGAEIKISESPANDWEPALAAAPDGTIWIAWDSYDRGNYDIFARSLRGEALSPVRQITRSTRFEAHASLAVDPQGRLWIGYDEAEVNWGKDYGYLFKDRGNPLYQTRRIRLVRLAGDRLEEPVQPIEGAFPLGLPEYIQYPQLAFMGDGRLTVAALQLTRADRVLEVWGARGVWENVAFTLDGAGWHRHSVLPSSTGAHDIRAAIAPAADGAVWVAWASDGRNFGNGAPQRQNVHAARLPASTGSGEVAMKPFAEPAELAFPTHPAEALNLRAVRGYRFRNQNKEYRILRGDLHRHTSLSADGVGDGSLWDLYRYVFDAASLDFSTVTDHQGGATAYNWWKIQKSTDLFHTPGRLTAIYAYERSVLYPNGHRNIVFPRRGAPILPIAPAEQQGKSRSADVVLPYLRQYNAIAFRHTSATNQGTDWKDHNNELEPLVEIFQGHRVVYEHEGGPHGATADKAYLQRSGYQPAGYIWNALAKGYRMGMQASSDHCSTHISYSCILAEGDSREAIIDAMRKRHTYGATDNIVLDFRVKADGKEYLQGEEFEARGPYTLTVNIIGTGPIRRVDVIRNESYAYAVTPTGKSVETFSYADPNPVAGENRYYVRVQQEDGALAWSSPVWIQYRRR
jgi:hypothetical protein